MKLYFIRDFTETLHSSCYFILWYDTNPYTSQSSYRLSIPQESDNKKFKMLDGYEQLYEKY